VVYGRPVAHRQITAVVFDIGGVLLDWNPRHLYRQLLDDPADLEEFLGQICTPEWHLAHDLGEDTEQSCAELARQHPAIAELIMAWAHRGEDMVAGQIDPVVEILAEVKGLGLDCYALSNMEPDTFEVRSQRYPFFAMLDGCVISGIERVAKPDRKIFDILISRYGLDPQATVFIDDSPHNVTAAGEADLVAIGYRTPEQLRSDLRDLGIDISADGQGDVAQRA
jgi:2-haloacid dehalogenase